MEVINKFFLEDLEALRIQLEISEKDLVRLKRQTTRFLIYCPLPAAQSDLVEFLKVITGYWEEIAIAETLRIDVDSNKSFAYFDELVQYCHDYFGRLGESVEPGKGWVHDQTWVDYNKQKLKDDLNLDFIIGNIFLHAKEGNLIEMRFGSDILYGITNWLELANQSQIEIPVPVKIAAFAIAEIGQAQFLLDRRSQSPKTTDRFALVGEELEDSESNPLVHLVRGAYLFQALDMYCYPSQINIPTIELT